MGNILLFILSFIIVLFIYEIFIVKKAKKNKKDKKPIEVRYLLNKYKVDLKKADYNQMLQIIALVSSLDISIIIVIISLFKTINMQILVGID